jgi:histidyl-tRNA synthetase
MANKTKFQAIKGTRDLLPPETELWNRVEQTAREVFGSFGFGEIRLPIFEPTELFARAVGGETDIVSKEMYTFEDRPFALEKPTQLRDTTVYIEQLRKHLQLGDIPSDEQNRKALEEYESSWRQLQSALEAPPSEMVGARWKEFQVAVFKFMTDESRLRLGPEVCLRPEATASVCRAYIEHGMQALTQPVKLYYMGPMFRRERPQKGRYRQFYQIGAEVLEAVRKEVASGDPDRVGAERLVASQKDAAIDAEVIEMVMAFFGRLELPGVQLEINSIGHDGPDCRRVYRGELYNALLKVRDRLGEDSKRRIRTNPLRVLDSKLESEQEIIATLPKIGDYLCEACKAHYAELKRQLDLRGVAYRENWRLVRGLDYYMRTTFEITARGLGSQNAVCGGGRYDGLVELLGGPPTKGIGFAIGEDRVILSLLETGHSPLATRHSPLLYIAWMGEKTLATAIRAARDLRQAGFRVELPPVEQKFGKALGQADKLGARYALILGEDEVASGQWTLKTLADGTQGKYSEAGLMEFLKKWRVASG